MEDRSIIELYLSRNEYAITATDEKYREYLFRIAYNILSHSEDSFECLNDTYFKTWNSIPPQIPHRLPAFLGKITRNLSLDRYRKSKAAKRVPDNVKVSLEELSGCIPSREDTLQVIDDMHLTEIIDGFLGNLRERDRIIFVKKYWYMDSVKNIARSMHMRESAVKMSLMRSRNNLRMILEKEGVNV